MKLGNLHDLITALGGSVGLTYATALKKAAGHGGSRLFDIDAVVKWRQKNPTWKMTDTYPRISRS
ncbi:MAG: hypothetical protein ACTHLW_21690, partial [Verrucomicrobiota bacterium]